MSHETAQDDLDSIRSYKPNTVKTVQQIFATEPIKLEGGHLVRRDVALPAWNPADPFFKHSIIAVFADLKMEAMAGIKPGMPVGIHSDLSHLNDMVVLHSSRGFKQPTGEQRQRDHREKSRSVTIIATEDAWKKVEALAHKKFGAAHPLVSAWEEVKTGFSRTLAQAKHDSAVMQDFSPPPKGVPGDLHPLNRESLDYFFRATTQRYEPNLVSHSIGIGFDARDRKKHTQITKIIDKLFVEALGERAKDVAKIRDERGGTTWVTTRQLWEEVRQYSADALLASSPNPESRQREHRILYPPDPAPRERPKNLLNPL